MAIGIQARTNSTRLKGKILEKIGDKPIINHVIDACEGAAHYVNRYTKSSGIYCQTYLLIPDNDPLKQYTYGIQVIEGSEQDVLSRYMTLLKETDAEFIVRVTSDCPLLPSFTIAKAINSAVRNDLDYVSNVDEAMRTSIDGHDVEVISKRCPEWANAEAKEKRDREHVTTIIRSDKLPAEFNVGILIGYVDLSEMKLSVDTPEDLKRAQNNFDRVQEKIKKAELKYGRKAIHRI